MKKVCIIVLLLAVDFLPSAGQSPDDLARGAMAAYGKKDFHTYLSLYQKIYQLRPRNPRVLYNLAGACALTGNTARAIALLTRLVEWGFEYGLTEDGDLEAVRDSRGYRGLLSKLEAMKTPVHTSTVAFTVPEKDLIPESIAYDSLEKVFYAGSLYKRKIVRVGLDRSVRDFTSERQDGLWSVLGMKVDPQRRLLWVCSSAEEIMKGFTEGEIGRSTGVFVYDLQTKNLRKRYLHLLNDLAFDPAGNVYITDTYAGAVYRISRQKDSMELLTQSGNLSGANGITVTPDGRFSAIRTSPLQ